MSWPAYVGITKEKWDIAWGTRLSPPSLQGTVQRVSSLGDLWVATVEILIRPEDRLQWNAYIMQRRGALRSITLGPVLDPAFPVSGTSVTSNTAAGATSLTLTVSSASAVPSQCYMGLGSNLYLAYSKVEDSGTQVTMSIFPPLRAAASASDTLDADPEATVYIETPELCMAENSGPSVIELKLREAV